MALVWSDKLDGTSYEVKTAGSTVRLYTDGVFHSQYNARTRISGGVWDLLMLPAFFHASDSIKRILVLGVGGGAVMRMFLEHLDPDVIVGVELDPTHITIARNYFGLKDKRIQLLQHDAIQWMKNYKGPAFDLIVEDLFGEEDGEPVRAVTPDCEWTRLLSGHLSDKGMIISNFLTRKEICRSGYEKNCKGQKKFESAWLLTDSRYENKIAVYSRLITSRMQLMERLSLASLNNPAFRKSIQNFSVKRLRCS